jgi:hypothetical protein
MANTQAAAAAEPQIGRTRYELNIGMILDKTIEFAIIGEIIYYENFIVGGKRTEALETIFETGPGTIIDNDYG